MIGLFKLFRKGVRAIGIFDFFNLFNKRSTIVEDPVENKYLKISDEEIDPLELLGLPTLTGCIEIITNTIASLPINLYKYDGVKVEPLEDDYRISLLNDYTGDTLNGFDFKKAMTHDYLIYGSAYGYINRTLNKINSLHYVDKRHVSVLSNHDPIFKRVTINVNGQEYQDYDFIRILRRTKNGADGVGILKENYEALSVMYMALKYEKLLVSSGGNKKGFIKSLSKLTKEAIADLKEQWNNMYNNNKSNCVVLNNGLEFQESANTSVEMQLNENKKTNSNEVCRIVGVPETVLNGTCSTAEYQTFIKVTILPILSAIETALNVALLSTNERKQYYFRFDTNELMKGDLLSRMNAFAVAVKQGIMQIDEVRAKEDLPPLGLDFIKLGLQDVLYDPVNKEIYTPNTDKTSSLKGGDLENEDRN